MNKTFTPLTENLISRDSEKLEYFYCDEAGIPVHKSKEIYPDERKIILYPYSVSYNTGIIRQSRIKEIEFNGWAYLDDLPKDFKIIKGYGFSNQRVKFFMNVIYRKFKFVDRLIIQRYSESKFGLKEISLRWSDLEPILDQIMRDHNNYNKNKKYLINNLIAQLTDKVEYKRRHLSSGELESFLKKFDSYTRISSRDIDMFAQIIDGIPTSNISITTHFIKTRDKIDVLYLENLIDDFEKLLNTRGLNEEKWQQFFEKNAWILTHLFAYQVILRKGKAYLGGKTIDNEDGRIVDFLFQSGFNDNCALLEIKTPNTQILKKTAYRSPDVYAVSDDLSGGINQCLDQKDVFLKEQGTKYKMFDPKCILVIGRKKELSESQSKCFELYRSNQKHIDIVTFDELFEKLKSLQGILEK